MKNAQFVAVENIHMGDLLAIDFAKAQVSVWRPKREGQWPFTSEALDNLKTLCANYLVGAFSLHPLPATDKVEFLGEKYKHLLDGERFEKEVKALLDCDDIVFGVLPMVPAVPGEISLSGQWTQMDEGTGKLVWVFQPDAQGLDTIHDGMASLVRVRL